MWPAEMIAASGYEKTRSDVRVTLLTQLADVGLARCQLQTISCVETSNGNKISILGVCIFDAEARSHGKARFDPLAEGLGGIASRAK